MLNYDFAPFYRSTVGFDRLLSLLDKHSGAEAASTYPPYNICLLYTSDAADE